MKDTSKKNYVTIDTTKKSAVVPAGLASPKKSICYHHPAVQKILSESFTRLLPLIVESEDGLAYQLMDEKGQDRCSKSEPAKNIADIPKSELLKLMEGWIRLRRRLQDEALSKKVKSILLNFKVPDPRNSIQQYRVEKWGDQKRLIVFWGYEAEGAPCVSIEKALSIYLEVPVEPIRVYPTFKDLKEA